MKQSILILALAGLTACGAQSVGPTIPDAANDTCQAAQYAGLIGQDATALERVLRLGEVRIIRPNTAVTADFRPSRINYEIGATNQIMRVYCG